MLGRIREKVRRVAKRAAHGMRRPTASKDVIVLVVGVQRSGTNMLMEVFERSWRWSAFHDHDPRAFSNFQPRALDVVRAEFERESARCIAFKPMTEMHRLRSMLDGLVEDSRGERGVGLWALRRMDDVVASHVKRWTGMPESMRRIASDPDWEDWRAGGLSRESRELVRRFAAEHLDNETACALFWYVRNVQFFEQGYDSMPDVALVPYEHCVADPTARFGNLFKRMGLPFDPAMTRHVHKASVGRAERPAVHPEVRALCENLERRFREHWAGIEA
jgi:hypothetical protein